jgi:hypothetical protein
LAALEDVQRTFFTAKDADFKLSILSLQERREVAKEARSDEMRDGLPENARTKESYMWSRQRQSRDWQPG